MNAIVNGESVPSDVTAMPDLPANPAGVFETLLWRDGGAQFWPEHWARFAAGIRWFGIQPDVTEVGLHDHVRVLVRDNQLPVAVVRYAAWRDADDRSHWRVDAGPPRPHMARPEFTTTLGPSLPPVDAARPFKHLNRTPWRDALRAARAAGYDEVLLRDPAGHIVEGAVSNVFLVHGDTLRTPALADGALPGVMRAAVLTVARALGWDAQESSLSVEELRAADEVWLTNSLIGLRPVRRLDRHPFALAHPRLEALRAAWRSVHGAVP